MNLNEKHNIISKIIKKTNKSVNIEPMPAEEIAQIQIAKNRTNTEFIELPESLQILLSIDKNYIASDVWSKAPLLKYFFERMDNNKKVHSAKVSDELYWMFEGYDLKGQKLLWNDVEYMPGIIEFYSGGDQRVYLYVGEKYNEEFPIARFDNEPCFWLTEVSLINHILSLCDDINELFKDDKDVLEFLNTDKKQELKRAKEVNESFLKKEWWHKKFQWPE